MSWRTPWRQHLRKAAAEAKWRPNPPPIPQAVFWGYPASVLREWCRVSDTTARLYKSGVRRPSKAVLRLFILHRDRRVLGEAWEGWRLVDDKLWSPEGIGLTQGQIRAYQQVYALAFELARRGSPERELLDRILADLDAA